MSGFQFKNDYGDLPPREPLVNLPAPVAWTAGLLIALFALVSFLPQELYQRVLIDYAFIPARSDGLPSEFGIVTPTSLGWSLLTMVTHAGLHGGIIHLSFNVVWLLAFGTPVARALGAVRFAALFILCAIGGAALFWLMHPEDIIPMIGASGAISGLMGAAVRYLLAAGPLNRQMFIAPTNELAPLNSVRFLSFSAVWFAINLVFGLFGSTFGEGGAIAWEAHMGGYAAGALLVGLLGGRR